MGNAAESKEPAREVAVLTSACPSPAQTSCLLVKKGFIAFSQIHDLKPETISETGVHFLTLAQIPDGS